MDEEDEEEEEEGDDDRLEHDLGRHEQDVDDEDKSMSSEHTLGTTDHRQYGAAREYELIIRKHMSQ